MLWVKVLIFFKKNAGIRKIKGLFVLKDVFLKVYMCAYFRTKFRVFGIFLTSLSQEKVGRSRAGGNSTPHPPPPILKETFKKPAKISIIVNYVIDILLQILQNFQNTTFFKTIFKNPFCQWVTSLRTHVKFDNNFFRKLDVFKIKLILFITIYYIFRK